MPIVLAHPSNSLSFRFSSHPPLNSNTSFTSFQNTPKLPLLKSQSKTLVSPKNSPVWRTTHISFCSRNDIFEDISSTQLPETSETDGVQDIEELELLGKPSPVPLDNRSASEVDSELKKPDKDEALAPFLKFFKSSDGSEEANGVSGEDGSEMSESGSNKMVSVEYYEPKPGDFVMGVVVSGNENKLDVNVGADLLGTMLTKEVLPLYDKEMEYLLCDVEKDAEDFMARGKMRIVRSDDALSWVPIQGRPVVETGTVLFAEVLGRTLSGRPLLSTRRFFRRIAWHRVRQIKQLNEPIEVRITEWNTGGLLTRIEGLRAFLPKAELLNRVKSFRELKENVGCRLYVQITRIDEAKNDLILSEKDAWEKMHLQEGTLLEGTVKKFFPYGAQIRIGESNRSGLLHISNITRARITSVSDLLAVDEKVKVLVVKSMFPNKIALSIADLESEPGLFLSNKEKVFSDAEEMAKKYRQRMPAVTATRKLEPDPTDALLPFHDEAILYANFRWFKFERDNEPVETRKEESEE